MTNNNPFADRLRSAAANVRGTARRDGLDQVRTVPFDAAIQAAEQADDERAYASKPDRTSRIYFVTKRQLAFIDTLFGERDYSGELRPKFQARLRRLHGEPTLREMLTVGEASTLIDYLLDLPKLAEKTNPFAETGEIPAGRYAYTGTEGHTVFVKVDRPTEGRWAGYTFVGQQIGDDVVRISRDHQAAALFAIAQAGIAVSAARYGHELGICGVCGRTLTNEESRDAGIGPVCRANMGW